MTFGTIPGDPFRMDLQWFAGEGNPGASGDSGQGGGSFLTGSGNADAKTGGQPAASDAGAPPPPAAATSQPAGAGQNSPSRTEAPADGGAQRPAWKAQLPKDLQEDARFDRFPSLGELGKAYVELEGKLGSSLSVPGEGASAEEWTAFYTKLGRPADGADYELPRLENLPPGLSYGDDSSFRAKAHELGLTKRQAAEMFKAVNDYGMAKFQEAVAAQRTARQEAESSLRKEWGKDYDANTELMRRAVTKYADAETLQIIEATGLGNDPRIARLFAKIGKELGEGSLVEGSGRPARGESKMFDYPELT